MDINSLTETLALALADDTALKTWAQATYGRDHQISINIDISDPPGQEQCPAIMLYPTGKRVSEERDEKPHLLQVELEIYDEGLVDPPTRTNLKTYIGMQRLESFRALAQTAIAAALPAALDIREIEIDYDTISDFPFFALGMVFNLVETVCIGGDYLG